MEVSVAVSGEVSLCGFDLDLQYDNTLLELREINDNHDLEIFTGHNRDTGIVSFNYSGVKNITKPKLILTLSFHIIGSAGRSARFTLIPKEIIKTDDRNRILPADYQLIDETVIIR